MVLFPKGTMARIRTLLDENDQLKAMLRKHGLNFHSNDRIEAHQDDFQAGLLQKINEIIKSNSWYITAPVRMLGYFLGKPKIRLDMVPQMQPHELQPFYQSLLASRSWRITAPLRRLRKNL